MDTRSGSPPEFPMMPSPKVVWGTSVVTMFENILDDKSELWIYSNLLDKIKWAASLQDISYTESQIEVVRQACLSAVSHYYTLWQNCLRPFRALFSLRRGRPSKIELPHAAFLIRAVREPATAFGYNANPIRSADLLSNEYVPIHTDPQDGRDYVGLFAPDANSAFFCVSGGWTVASLADCLMRWDERVRVSRGTVRRIIRRIGYGWSSVYNCLTIEAKTVVGLPSTRISDKRPEQVARHDPVSAWQLWLLENETSLQRYNDMLRVNRRAPNIA